MTDKDYIAYLKWIIASPNISDYSRESAINLLKIYTGVNNDHSI